MTQNTIDDRYYKPQNMKIYHCGNSNISLVESHHL